MLTNNNDLCQDNNPHLELIRRIISAHPETTPFLEYQTPFQLLVAVILSAQCTDAKVNEVTRVLYRDFPTPEALAQAPLETVRKIVYPTGFYQEKAARIIETARLILSDHQGKVPLGMEELTRLPGVGRKTANVVRGQIGGLPAVIVDTHFKRVVKRLGLSGNEAPEAVEKDLGRIVPPEIQFAFSMAANRHGRVFCTARKPRCSACPVQDLCPQG